MALERLAQIEIETVGTILCAPVAEVRGTDWTVRGDEDAGGFQQSIRASCHQRITDLAEFKRHAAICTFEKATAKNPLVIQCTPEHQLFSIELASAIAGLLQETAPLELIMTWQGIGANFAADFGAQVERMFAERKRCTPIGIPLRISIVGAEPRIGMKQAQASSPARAGNRRCRPDRTRAGPLVRLVKYGMGRETDFPSR